MVISYALNLPPEKWVTWWGSEAPLGGEDAFMDYLCPACFSGGSHSRLQQALAVPPPPLACPMRKQKGVLGVRGDITISITWDPLQFVQLSKPLTTIDIDCQ